MYCPSPCSAQQGKLFTWSPSFDIISLCEIPSTRYSKAEQTAQLKPAGECLSRDQPCLRIPAEKSSGWMSLWAGARLLSSLALGGDTPALLPDLPQPSLCRRTSGSSGSLPLTQLPFSSFLIVLCNYLSPNSFGYLLKYVKWEIWRWLGIIILWWVNKALQHELSDYKH